MRYENGGTKTDGEYAPCQRSLHGTEKQEDYNQYNYELYICNSLRRLASLFLKPVAYSCEVAPTDSRCEEKE
jgi:hypothetical protein